MANQSQAAEAQPGRAASRSFRHVCRRWRRGDKPLGFASPAPAHPGQSPRPPGVLSLTECRRLAGERELRELRAVSRNLAHLGEQAAKNRSDSPWAGRAHPGRPGLPRLTLHLRRPPGRALGPAWGAGQCSSRGHRPAQTPACGSCGRRRGRCSSPGGSPVGVPG